MATEKPRYNITVDEDMFAEIERFRYENKISTRSKATVELIRIGITELLNRMNEKEAKKNKAPTAESAMEALYEVMYFYFGRPPKVEEVEQLLSIVPVICKGVRAED